MNFIQYFITCVIAAAAFGLFHNCSSDTYNYDLDIRNKYWKLTELDGDTVVTIEGQREPHVLFKLNEETVKLYNKIFTNLRDFTVPLDKDFIDKYKI